MQPLEPDAHGVFHVHPAETIDYHYERNPADPRVGHELVLEVDDYGNVLKSASAGYGRRRPDPALPPPVREAQARMLVTYVENTLTNALDTDAPGGASAYRTPLPAETITYELTGMAPAPGRDRLTPDVLLRAAAGAVTVPSAGPPPRHLHPSAGSSSASAPCTAATTWLGRCRWPPSNPARCRSTPGGSRSPPG